MPPPQDEELIQWLKEGASRVSVLKGAVEGVRVVRDKATSVGKGFAFVLLKSQVSVYVLQAMHACTRIYAWARRLDLYLKLLAALKGGWGMQGGLAPFWRPGQLRGRSPLPCLLIPPHWLGFPAFWKCALVQRACLR